MLQNRWITLQPRNYFFLFFRLLRPDKIYKLLKTTKMLLLSQAPARGGGEALSNSSRSFTTPPKFSNPKPPLFSSRPKFVSTSKKLSLTLTKAESSNSGHNNLDSRSAKPSLNVDPVSTQETVFVGEESVPLEGVIQFDKPNSSARINKWGYISLLAGGDVLGLLLFSAIGRFSHGFSVLDFETLRTADPFIAGWFLSAYFLGGYSEDGRGMNGLTKAVTAAAKSWSLGIPLGIAIRAAASGHIPNSSFILVSMGSTAVILIGWRALLFSIFPNNKNKKNDTYRSGNPFELFELLTSLVRRW